MKGGFNKVFRNFAAMKGKTEFDKVRGLQWLDVKIAVVVGVAVLIFAWL